MSILNVDTIQPVGTGTTVTINNGDLIVGTGLTIGRSGVVTATSFAGAVTGNVTGNLSGDIVGTRTLGTGVTVTAAGIISCTQYYGSASAMTAIPGGNITGTIPAASLGNVDLSGIKKDIALLSLQNAVDTNRVAYNLTNSFIDQFEDETGVGTKTDMTYADEAYSTNSLTVTAYNFKTSSTSNGGQPEMLSPNEHGVQSTWGGVSQGSQTGNSWTNDRVLAYGGSTGERYSAGYINFAFDLRYDFTTFIRVFLDANGFTGNHSYGAYTAALAFGTFDIAPGRHPTLNGSSIFRGPISGDHAHYGQLSSGNWGSKILTSAAATELNESSWSSNGWAGAGDDATYDASSMNANGGLVKAYVNNDNNGILNDHHGLIAINDRSANTLTLGFIGGAYASTMYSGSNEGKTTITNVPANGLAFFLSGNATGSNGGNGNYIGNVTGSSSAAAQSSGSYAVGSTSATGTLIGTANTVTGARTKVSGVMLYKDTEGTAGLGTDLKVSVTCNGGTNWTALSSGSDYSAGADFSTGVKTVYLAEKTCTSGTDIRYKIEWANQADGSKETQLHGIALNY